MGGRARVVAFVCVLAACGEAVTPPGGDAGPGPDARPTPDCTADLDCDDGRYCTGVERCMPGASGADRRGCVAGTAPCDVVAEVCDEDARACLSGCDAEDDADGDGARAVACGGGDCADDDPERFPGNVEVCDATAHDEDCDPLTYGFRDADSDGVADARCCNETAAGSRACGRDCDDMSPTTHPTAPEVCDGLDQDCDGSVDEGVLRTFYADADGDRFGAWDAAPVEACTPPPGTVEGDRSDCDDAAPAVHPGAVEACAPPGVDDNCNAAADEGCACSEPSRPCPGAVGACRSGVQPCIGSMWGPCSISPVEETCNGVDDDCDGSVDEGVSLVCWRDADGDGVPAPGSAERVCPRPGGGCPAGTTATPATAALLDCDDTNRASSGSWFFCYDDLDGDGYAGAAPASSAVCDAPGAACPGGSVRSATPADCDDTRAAVSPAAAEVCNGIDDDCDRMLDECSTFMHGRRACVAGACTQVGCDATYADCNGSAADGCEVSLRAADNCGACGVVCAEGEGCCGMICTSLDSISNCGACGLRCPSGRVCCALDVVPYCTLLAGCE